MEEWDRLQMDMETLLITDGVTVRMRDLNSEIATLNSEIATLNVAEERRDEKIKLALSMSMEPTGLLSLPVEVLHYISKYLDVPDVLNCSQTCHYLHTAMNDNRVWRKFVPKKALQLEGQDQILEPALQWSDSFAQACDFRLHYMRLNHLLKNWRTKHFAKYDFTPPIPNSDNCGVYNNIKGRGQVLYKDRYLFLARIIDNNEFETKSDGIEVWDLGEKPELHSFLGIKNVNYDHFYIVSSNLVVVECKKVYVYQISLPEKHFPLLYSFLITDSEVTRNGDVCCEGSNIPCVGWINCNVGQYFMANMCRDNGDHRLTIHVWDIFKASKVGAFALPVVGLFVTLKSHDGDEWLLSVLQSSSCSKYFLFNVKEMSFAETGLEIERLSKETILYKSHIIVINDYSSQGLYYTTCVVYDSVMSTEVRKRCFYNTKKTHFFSSSTIVNGSFLLYTSDGFQVIDALTLETINLFQCELDARFITCFTHLDFFGSIFVAVGDQNTLCLFNVTKKEKLIIPLDFCEVCDLNLNEAMNKVVTIQNCKVTILHFW